MHLLAVIDTFEQMQLNQGAIDECGIRFLLSFKIFLFLRKSIPISSSDRPNSLSSIDFAWALHSEAEDTLIRICFGNIIFGGQDSVHNSLNWSFAQSIGVGYWIKNPNTLRSLIEVIAKAQYQEKKDPQDCALFYIALDKKNTLTNLYRLAKNQVISDFLKNDFQMEKWKIAACKNAYVLLGKQKFQLAAAFFLLGGSLKDSINIIIQKLKDYQLALVISRLVEGDSNGEIFQFILNNHLLLLAKESNDNALLSLCYWLLKKYDNSITSLLPDSSSLKNNQLSSNKTIFFDLESIKRENSFNPNILYLFNFLRKHTMLRNTQLQLDDLHFILVKKSAFVFIEKGYTLLALEELIDIINKLKKKRKQTTELPKKTNFFGSSAFGKFYRGEPSTSLDDNNNDSSLETNQTIEQTLLFKVSLQLLTEV